MPYVDIQHSSASALFFNLLPQVCKNPLPLSKMTLQALDLFAHGLDIFPRALEILPILGSSHALPQLPKLAFLVLQQLQSLLLNENPIRPAVIAWPIPPRLRSLPRGFQLLLHLRQLPTQPDLLPLLILDRVAKVRALGLIRALAANAQPAQVCVSEFCLAPCSSLLVAISAPALRRPYVVNLVVDLVALERGAQRGGNCARDSESLVSVVEDVQERQRGVFVNGLTGGRVDQVPCGADVGVGDVEGFIEGMEGLDCSAGLVSILLSVERAEMRLTSNLAAVVPVGAIDLFVLGLVCGLHVPIETILQTKRVVLIFYALELFGSPAQRTSRMDEM